jgi:pseudouridine kinase
MDYLLAVGASNMDIAGHSTGPVRAGDSNPGRIAFAPGGVARNVAHNLALLGHRIRLVSAVGDDLPGHSLRDATAAAGVDVQACWMLPGQATSCYVSLHGPDGEAAMAVNDMQIVASITPERLAPLAADIAAAQAVLLDCNLSAQALAWLCTHSGSVPLCVDAVSAAKCVRIAPWLQRVRLLKANQLEAETLTSLPLRSLADAPAVAGSLHRQGVRQAVLSLGALGLYWSDAAGACGTHAAWPGPVVNTTGAGDALMAGLLHGLVAGHSLAQAVRFASACAGLVLQVPAANNPNMSLAQVQSALNAMYLEAKGI